jgi:hypothetical protein
MMLLFSGFTFALALSERRFCVGRGKMDWLEIGLDDGKTIKN